MTVALDGSLEDLDPLVILAFDHNGYLGSDSIKYIGDLTKAVLVDSFLRSTKITLCFCICVWRDCLPC